MFIMMFIVRKSDLFNTAYLHHALRTLLLYHNTGLLPTKERCHCRNGIPAIIIISSSNTNNSRYTTNLEWREGEELENKSVRSVRSLCHARTGISDTV